MNTLITTQEFDRWLDALKDFKARARIVTRIISAEQGNAAVCR
ncbi:hypothetical protein NVV94_05170 [Pseudomonas sp. LS1212]|nr:hypothetical protein [Pseudomonas sp. LS1212]UVJ44977.1 hypothetical protein NVV94_05170 [Pseudomonas sp. LS1212]